MSPKFESWAKPAIRVAAARLGVAVAGPLGGAIGGWLGLAVGGPAAQLIAKYADKFGEKAAEALLDEGKDSLIERLKSEAPDLESAYRETLQLSLAAIRSTDGDGYADWFD